MATMIRPSVSKRNKYWIDKHRHYELKHFCLQYPIWKREYSELDGYSGQDYDGEPIRSNIPGDPTLRLAEKRLIYFDHMNLIEQTAIDADPELYVYILKAVTEGLSFTYLKTKQNMPCSKDTYYDRYRRFFWLLDKTRY